MRTHHTLPSETPLTPAHRRLLSIVPATILLIGTPLFGQQPNPSQPAPQPPKPPAGCVAAPVKKPRFQLPAKLKQAISKNVDKVAGKTGVELDKNAPDQAIKDAQQNKPCVSQQPAPVPAATPSTTTPVKQ